MGMFETNAADYSHTHESLSVSAGIPQAVG